LIAGLLAASLIDAELFIIPLQIPWLLAVLGIIVHAIFDTPRTPGALNVGPYGGAIAAGGGIGLAASLLLWFRGIIPMSFPKGEPMLEVDKAALPTPALKPSEGETIEYESEVPPQYTKAEIRREIGKELAFLLPPMLLAAVWVALIHAIPSVSSWWRGVMSYNWLSGMLGAVLGALIGAFVVWITRILGTLGFGRVAMGLGDVHLMFGVGAIIGAGAATVAFFLAPFFGIAIAIYMLLTGTRRELPYGPYLSLATAFVLLFYCDIAEYLRPGMQGLGILIENLFGAPAA
jgi:leader peptidase (prepilin peptidase)/N-methyltransferase